MTYDDSLCPHTTNNNYRRDYANPKNNRKLIKFSHLLPSFCYYNYTTSI